MEEASLASMMMAWYQSGFHTGYVRGTRGCPGYEGVCVKLYFIYIYIYNKNIFICLC